MPNTIYLKDYQAPDYLIKTIDLVFDLEDRKTIVTSTMKIERNTDVDSQNKGLYLNGEEIKLLSVKINGELLDKTHYELADDHLKIPEVPDHFVLEIQNEVDPVANTALDGLYKSGTIFCTQCEAEGFRRITYYQDRPDVMAKFTTKIIADKSLYPVLLSNGNLIDSGDLDNGKHWALWEDPFLKPCYLFALVAGDLGLVQSTYKTVSGREIDLRVYCDKGNESKCDHAIESLKKSMKWDEDTFGLEYDLDIYMIVAVDSFNMGAMENKGLNIFNSVYVLANQETATDTNFLGIESVVGHEYFHNWTGNRITCRDWFQLTLKEGLTVYRDQEFSSDLNDRTVQRISDVQSLRSRQFVEDASPMSHPIKPSEYIEINNFYTATIYEKGSEVIRMVRTFLGKDGFRKGMDKYFELYDGQAVTTEDFLHAMSVANNNYDLEQFKLWYSQAGTPDIHVHSKYDEAAQTLSLTLDQSCAPTKGQEHKLAYHMPFKVGLLKNNGEDFKLSLKSENANQPQLDEGILHLRKESETFVFENISEEPVLSLNRGFTAPVKVHSTISNQDLAFMMSHDSDEFNRFEAGQQLAMRTIYLMLEKNDFTVPDSYLEAYGTLLKDRKLSDAFKSLCLSIPTESILFQGHQPIDVQGIHKARKTVLTAITSKFKNEINDLYDSLNDDGGEFKLDNDSIGRRSLKNRMISMMKYIDDEKTQNRVWNQFENATNMTDEICAFNSLISIDNEKRDLATNKFYDKWNHETLVIQKWLGALAGCSLDNTFDAVMSLESDPVYDSKVPNLFRSLVGAFCMNPVQFHHESGRGYEYAASKIIEMDDINPQIASRVAGAFGEYKKLKSSLQEKMKPQLERILAKENLSKHVYEKVSKIL